MAYFNLIPVYDNTTGSINLNFGLSTGIGASLFRKSFADTGI